MSYTNNQKKVEVRGNNVQEVLDNLETLFPGIRFRFIDEQNNIRVHMAIYRNKEQVKSLSSKVEDSDEIFITQVLSGG